MKTKVMDKAKRQQIHAEFVKIMKQEKQQPSTLRQKITDILLTMEDVWSENLAENKSLGFISSLGNDVDYEGKWDRGNADDTEQCHVTFRSIKKRYDPHDLGKIEVRHGLFVNPHQNELSVDAQPLPPMTLRDSAEITVTSPAYRYEDGILTILSEEKIRVYLAPHETPAAVVDRMYQAIAQSRAKKADRPKKLGQLSLTHNVVEKPLEPGKAI